MRLIEDYLKIIDITFYFGFVDTKFKYETKIKDDYFVTEIYEDNDEANLRKVIATIHGEIHFDENVTKMSFVLDTGYRPYKRAFYLTSYRLDNDKVIISNDFDGTRVQYVLSYGEDELIINGYPSKGFNADNMDTISIINSKLLKGEIDPFMALGLIRSTFRSYVSELNEESDQIKLYKAIERKYK